MKEVVEDYEQLSVSPVAMSAQEKVDKSVQVEVYNEN